MFLFIFICELDDEGYILLDCLLEDIILLMDGERWDERFDICLRFVVLFRVFICFKFDDNDDSWEDNDNGRFDCCFIDIILFKLCKLFDLFLDINDWFMLLFFVKFFIRFVLFLGIFYLFIFNFFCFCFDIENWFIFFGNFYVFEFF